MLIYFFLLSLAGGGEVLVLKDGKAIPITAPFEVKENFVHFKDAKGRLVMLPLKVVDMEETKRRTEQANAADVKPPEKNQEPEESDDLVAHVRTQQTDMVLTDRTLNRFNTENPRDDLNPAMDTGDYRPSSPSGTRNSRQTWAARNRRNETYQRQIEAIEQQIRDKKEEIRSFQTENGIHWDFNYEKEHTKQLKSQLANLEKRLLDLKNYVRTGPAPPPATTSTVSAKTQAYHRNIYNQRIKNLRRQIKETEERIRQLKRNNGSPYYLSQLAYRKERAADYERQIKAYRQEILDIQKEARSKGIDTQ